MSDQGFSRDRRLLASAQFKAVFDHTPYRISSKYLLLLARPNDVGHARLGLVVSKKNIRRAVARNRVKRLARETFRTRLPSLDALDVLFLARSGLDVLPPAEQTTQINHSWQRLAQRVGRGLPP